jgi:putative PEP-CTERM system histidine kinase
VNLTSMPFETSVVIASSLITAVIGLFVTLRRGHWLTTLLFSAAFFAVAAFQAGTLGILHAQTPESARQWAIYLGRSSALASWLWLALTLVLARRDPWEQVRNSASYLALALAGSLALSLSAGSAHVVRDVSGRGSPAFIELGALGRVYLMYLIIAMVAMLMNLERMLRNTLATTQKRLRPIFLALSFAIFTELIMVSGGLLYGGIKVSWLVGTAAPLFVAGIVTALSLARRRLSDLTMPAARPVVYFSSVSLTLAAGFLLAMAVLSKVMPTLSNEGRLFVSVAFYVLAGGGGLVLVFSPRANRGIRRFIDRNFYANRYDYRREWERVSNAITPTARIEDIGRQVDALMRAVFESERVAIYLRREPDGAHTLLHGPEAMPAEFAAANPLIVLLERSREPVVFREAAVDLELLPAAAENRDAILALDAAVCAPLLVGDVLAGSLWVSAKRTREDYSSEDVAFIGAMARQVAAALWFARQADQLAETRQLESLNRLSTFVLHDIKNHVSGLSLVVENARRHMANPEFQRDALAVIERTVRNLKELMTQVSGLARTSELHPEPCDVRDLLEEATLAAGLTLGERDGLRVAIDCPPLAPVLADRTLLLRLLVNLVTNARESLVDDGEITLSAVLDPGSEGAAPTLVLGVRDTGRGMSDEFLRMRLFRPFVTTKPSGLGVGLAQCRSIVEAHGGSITVESRQGHGTRFEVRLPAGGRRADAREPAAGERRVGAGEQPGIGRGVAP